MVNHLDLDDWWIITWTLVIDGQAFGADDKNSAPSMLTCQSVARSLDGTHQQHHQLVESRASSPACDITRAITMRLLREFASATRRGHTTYQEHAARLPQH